MLLPGQAVPRSYFSKIEIWGFDGDLQYLGSISLAKTVEGKTLLAYIAVNGIKPI